MRDTVIRSALPYRVFSKDQRVSHTAVVENKRLNHALSIVKTQQDLKLATKVMTNSEKDGYKKRPRPVYGPEFDEKTRSRAAVTALTLTFYPAPM